MNTDSFIQMRAFPMKTCDDSSQTSYQKVIAGHPFSAKRIAIRPLQWKQLRAAKCWS
jgi:hypothetical protein